MIDIKNIKDGEVLCVININGKFFCRTANVKNKTDEEILLDMKLITRGLIYSLKKEGYLNGG